MVVDAQPVSHYPQPCLQAAEELCRKELEAIKTYESHGPALLLQEHPSAASCKAFVKNWGLVS